MATEPVIKGAWLKPGSHLDLVGGYQPQMRESDDECIRRARVYVDSRWFTLGQAGDIKTPIDYGVMTEADIAGDLFELSRGTVPARLNDDEITLFKNGGGGHLDLGTAKFLLSRHSS
jgi:ornithine cyclodeaminase